jgi:cob(I)alamin adenosyltransferase
MELHLIDGSFACADAIDLVTQLYEVKIKYHTDKIAGSHNEEDIKMREQKIKLLQNELANSREFILKNAHSVVIHNTLTLQTNGN